MIYRPTLTQQYTPSCSRGGASMESRKDIGGYINKITNTHICNNLFIFLNSKTTPEMEWQLISN